MFLLKDSPVSPVRADPTGNAVTPSTLKKGLVTCYRVTKVKIVRAAGSVAFMSYMGHHQRSLILTVLFTVWVLSPFAALLWADERSKYWSPVARYTLLAAAVLITVRSLAVPVSAPWQNRDKTPRGEPVWVSFERKADSPSC